MIEDKAPALMTKLLMVLAEVGAVIAPAEETAKTLEAATWVSIKLPVNPEAAFIPKPVPEVDQLVEVVPEGSTKIWGLVVVALPPLNQVPVKETGGADTAPLVEKATATLSRTIWEFG